jgi:hypothetical protein
MTRGHGDAGHDGDAARDDGDERILPVMSERSERIIRQVVSERSDELLMCTPPKAVAT